MRLTLLLTILVFLPASQVSGDGEPCFFGSPTTIHAVDLAEEQSFHLKWTEVDSAEWYEVMRCDASGGPCSLRSLTTTEMSSFIDSDSGSSNQLWYRIIARTGPPADLCAPQEYCSVPTGKCAGVGICSLRSELCPPEFVDPVCGCGNQSFQNACYSSEFAANIRHWGACAR